MHILEVHIRGTSPCIMQADTLANPLHPAAKRMAELNAKKTRKTDTDREEIAQIEFKNSLYWDKRIGPYWPDFNIERCLRDAAKLTRHGRDVERGLKVLDARCPLLYKGPRDPGGLLADPRFVSARSVVIGGKRVIRTRPIFENWELKFTLGFDPNVFKDVETVKAIIEAAGQYIGLSTFRPRYGRFEIVSITQKGVEPDLPALAEEKGDLPALAEEKGDLPAAAE